MGIAGTRTSYYDRAVKGELLDDILIIDHHGHLNSFECILRPPSEILATMDSMSIDRAVLFTTGFKDLTELNDLTIRTVQRYPERFIGYAFARLKQTTPQRVVAELERCCKAGLLGVKLASPYDSVPYTDPSFDDIWAFCAEHNMPAIIHGLPLQIVRDNPDTIFIGAHNIERVGDPEAIETLKNCPNYYIGTSATITQMGAIETIVELVGADRLLYGSDLPFNNISTRLGAVLTARISDADMRKILGQNIARLLNLKLRDSFPR